MNDVRELFKTDLPEGYGYNWSSLSFQEARNEGTAVPLILLAVLFGYLFLVAHRGRWGWQAGCRGPVGPESYLKPRLHTEGIWVAC